MVLTGGKIMAKKKQPKKKKTSQSRTKSNQFF